MVMIGRGSWRGWWLVVLGVVAVFAVAVRAGAEDTAGPGSKQAKGMMLPAVPHGGPGNSYARGLSIALSYAGTPTDYDSIMGDTGMAFILQAEEGGPIVNGSVDVGWWPLGAWGVEHRVGFLAQTAGRDIRVIAAIPDDYQADPAAHYQRQYAREITTSLASGRPVLAEQDLCFVITGLDNGKPPILGMCPLAEERKAVRDTEYPWGLMVLGDVRERMDRLAADREALRYAAALGQDAVEVSVPEPWDEWNPITNRTTGQKSFALWQQALRDTEHLGEPRYHANMVLHLGLNRRSAVVYLRAMAKRHPQAAAVHLNAAADQYQQVLAALEAADTSEAAMNGREGRERLAHLVGRCAEIEAKAVGEIEQAVEAMR